MLSKDIIDYTICAQCAYTRKNPATHINWYGWSDEPTTQWPKCIPLCDEHKPNLIAKRDNSDLWFDYDLPVVKVEVGSELNIALECAFAVLAGTMRP